MALKALSEDSELAGTAGPLSLDTLSTMASGLAATIDAWRDRLPKHPDRRTGLRLLATEAFDAWLLRWPPNTSVDPHDHGESAGALAVATGALLEISWVGSSRRVRRLGPAEVVTFGRGAVHDVISTSQTSLSVHVYSPPLTTMSFYDSPGGAAVERVEVADQESTFAEARATHAVRSG